MQLSNKKQQLRRRLALVLLPATLLTAVATTSWAGGLKLGKILKVGGIGVVVKQFNKPINKAINTLLMTNKVPQSLATKVVPVITAGKGLYVGAVQVAGPANAVSQVTAVAQVEARYQGKFRMLVLIPTNTLNPLANPHRVNGVGISAEIDIKI